MSNYVVLTIHVTFLVTEISRWLTQTFQWSRELRRVGGRCLTPIIGDVTPHGSTHFLCYLYFTDLMSSTNSSKIKGREVTKRIFHEMIFFYFLSPSYVNISILSTKESSNKTKRNRPRTSTTECSLTLLVTLSLTFIFVITLTLTNIIKDVWVDPYFI